MSDAESYECPKCETALTLTEGHRTRRAWFGKVWAVCENGHEFSSYREWEDEWGYVNGERFEKEIQRKAYQSLFVNTEETLERANRLCWPRSESLAVAVVERMQIDFVLKYHRDEILFGDEE